MLDGVGVDASSQRWPPESPHLRPVSLLALPSVENLAPGTSFASSRTTTQPRRKERFMLCPGSSSPRRGVRSRGAGLWPWAALLFLLALSGRPAGAQTIDDGVMMPRRRSAPAFSTRTTAGTSTGKAPSSGQREHRHGHDAERDLGGQLRSHRPAQRDRHGALRLDATRARARSHGQSGFQDLTLAAKYNLLETPFTKARLAARDRRWPRRARPSSDYIPDLLPLSIGMAQPSVSRDA